MNTFSKKSFLLFFVMVMGFSVALLMTAIPANAVLWGSAATELEGSRSSSTGGGIYATEDWANGGFNLSWDIDQLAADLWQYQYTVNVNRKEVSHFILEVTEGYPVFEYYDGTSGPIEGPTTYSDSEGGSNPGLPNDIYGVKFDFGALQTTYTIVTDRAPVYGNFYMKDGKTGGNDVYAYNVGLSNSGYRTADLDVTKWIVRPDGDTTPVPEPSALLLLGSGLVCLFGLRKRFMK